MRKHAGMALIATCIALGFAQNGIADSGDMQAKLIALEQKWAVALEKADTAALDTILAATYRDTDEDGNQGNKKDVLDAFAAHDFKLESLKLKDMKVDMYTNAAVVRGAAEQRGTYKGKPIQAVNVVFTDTFIMHDGKWQAVASQRSPVK